MAQALPKTYKAAVIEAVNQPLVVKDVELRTPGPREVLVKVIVCGVCHSDSVVQAGVMGDVFPRVPGHELVGDVVAIGDGVTRVSVGDRVGGAWHGGHDATCRACVSGLSMVCDNRHINGVHSDGGYGEYAILRDEGAVRLPKDADPAEIAPMLCAGVAVFNGLRKLHIEQGSIVAIQGMGGLGHLGVQFARKMGYRTVAISSGSSKEEFARQLGAHDYIDSSKDDVVTKLKSLGGAAAIVATAPNPKSISPLINGLQTGGKLLLLAPVGPVEFDVNTLILYAVSIHGWSVGHALDSEDTVNFAQLHGVKAMIEKFPLGDAQKALEHCASGKVRFRGVLVM